MPPKSPRNPQRPDEVRAAKQAAARSQLKQLAIERAADQIDRKINQQVMKGADKVARKTAHHLEHLDRLTAHLEVLDVWTRAEPGSRRPRFTRETIAATAIRIADAEGFAAVSMRRIAAELDAGTMTLYHYVRTKDELLALITDTLMAELIVPPDEMPADWRGAITAIAHRSRDMTLRHSWLLDIADDPNIGPNSVRHFDQSLQAVSMLDGSLVDKLDLMTVVDEYVFGYCLHHRQNFQDNGTATVSKELVDYVDELSSKGGYPQLAKLIAEHGSHNAWSQVEKNSADPERFDRNLNRILDGFEADLAKRRAAS